MATPIVSNKPVCEIDLDAEGKQTGYVRIQFSSDRSAYGWQPVPIMSIKNGEGPVAVLVGANHGDEYEGVSVTAGLFRDLMVEDVKGQIIFLPALNAPAFYAGKRTSPLDETGEANLNRLFPGVQNGSPTQMICWWAVNELLPKVDAVFDLHSAGKSIDHHPSVKIRLIGDERKDAMQMRFLELFGAPLGIVGDRVTETTFSSATARHEIMYLSTELGGAGKIRPWIREFSYNGMKRCLREMGILPAEMDLPAPEHKVALKGMQGAENYIFAYEDGMFEPIVNLGDMVEAGQLAGYIMNLKAPWKEPTKLRFKKAGVVFCKRTPALCEVGDTLFFTLDDYEG